MFDTAQANFECTRCEIDFKATYKEDGYLPDCPRCGIDYRVYEKEVSE